VDALVRTVEQIIARIAGSQHGIVTWAEMIAAGISAEQIRHRVRIGLLVRVHRGVYSAGHRVLTLEARYLAAVKGRRRRRSAVRPSRRIPPAHPQVRYPTAA
jgi:hypothetical protein